MAFLERLSGGVSAPLRLLRKVYDWCLSLADRPSGEWSLLALSFAESTFFPVPPDILLMALALGRPSRAFRFAFTCTVGSALGGLFGYLIGVQFYDIVVQGWLEQSHYREGLREVLDLYRDYGGWVTAVAGFTPIPYKLFTIGAGIARVNLPVFFVASVLSRGARFFIIAGLLRWKGEPMRRVVEKHFDRISVLAVLVLALAYLLYRAWGGG